MKKDRLNKFLNGKGFYVALGICLIAIGFSAWSGYSAFKATDGDKHTENDSSLIITPSSSAQQNSEALVNEEKEDIKYESDTESAEPVESATKAEAPAAKYFLYPVNGEIIKDFSDTELQFSLTYNDMRLHTGIDIAADLKTAVNSSGDGTVIFAGKDELLGYTVKIDHGNNITAVYAGLSEALKVKEGDIVTSGTNIGSIGVVTSECVDAPHLHLEFYDNSLPVSPLSLLSDN